MDLFTTFESVPVGEQKNVSALYSDYCSKFDRLESFFAWDYRSSTEFQQAAQAVLQKQRDRQQLAKVLREQNAEWHRDQATEAQIDRLEDDQSVAVVTGQQLGLFGGPLYTIFKAVSAIQLAKKLERDLGGPVIPVFWLEGEDHDLEEVGQVVVHKGNEPFKLLYGGDEHNRTPVGRLKLSNAITDIIQTIEEILPPSDFREQTLDMMRQAYREGVTFLDAFARFMKVLFAGTGLVFINPDNPRLKALASGLFKREINDHATSNRHLSAAGDALEHQYHAQVRTSPLNLFMFDGSERLAIDVIDETFHLRGSDRRYTQDELSALVDASPESFSTNVVLRPLLQDTLLPTVAYVAGPGEIAYFAQYRGLYEWAEIPMPVIVPRLSATLVEGKVRRILGRYSLTLPDLSLERDGIFKQLVSQQMDVNLEDEYARVLANVQSAFEPLGKAASQVDTTLEGAAAATVKNLERELDRLRTRIMKAEKRKHDTIAAQMDKVFDNLYPFGKPQERVISVLHFMSRYGTDFVQRAVDLMPLETSRHHIVDL